MAAELAIVDEQLPALQPGPQLQWEIEQFYYAEAQMLDDRCYEEWLALMAEDVTYDMPLRIDRLRRDGKRFKLADEIMIFADNLERLEARVRRIRSGTAWSEDPRSRGRHFVTNVQITVTGQPNELEVSTNFLVYVSRMDEPPSFFSGQRVDVLRRDDSGRWKIKKREVLGDQSVIPSNNLTLFF